MKNNKFMAFFVTFAAIFFISLSTAYSDSYRSIVYETSPANYQSTTNNYQISSKGIASAISAAQCHFDGGSFDLQLCGGYGNAFGQDAYTFGAGQKVGDFLLNFTETTENGKSSHGFGVNWKVKFK